MKTQIVPTTEEHIVELSRTIKNADREEIWATAHIDPYHALKMSVQFSDEPLTGLYEGKVVCIFGVSRLSPFSEKAAPWAITSDLVYNNRHLFLRLSRVFMETVCKRYTFLENHVDCRHIEAVKWLKWMGFRMDNPRPFGPEKLLFRRFEFRKK